MPPHLIYPEHHAQFPTIVFLTPSFSAGGNAELMCRKHGTRCRMLVWFHDRLEDEHCWLMLLAVDPSTHKSYSSALHSYFQFCAIHSPNILPIPNTLSLYISFISLQSTLNQYQLTFWALPTALSLRFFPFMMFVSHRW
jgi:hypothetical protein